MRLLTHNMLASHVKGVKKGFPLAIEATNVVVKAVDFNPDFISRMIPRLEWSALFQAAQWIGHADKLPATVPEGFEENEEFLKAAHHCLMEIEVMEGHLVCPESSHKFPILNGIPNMLLAADE
ncbi:multifunctional methyltransferase subunit TRM112-like protein [Sycon ciliatum]|uniref:multifunctional methyltransferase subunit TRM112-like protein n=1 Tax=Sycon ciliatum TaxID=27933 RepID=UPI0020A9EA30|eukprot:scpid85486/ scgid14810/ tRNA methyltransferase 112 homolog; TRM112-like protein